MTPASITAQDVSAATMTSFHSDSDGKGLEQQAKGSDDSFSFGPFHLFPRRRLLLNGNKPLHVGSKALDILILLVERRGQVVTKQALMSHAWPGITVEESSLRVHTAGLRKVLGDGIDDASYIKTIPGRGYCFIASTSSTKPAERPHLDADTRPDPAPRLPPPLRRMIGRDDDVREISDLLTAKRFVTVHGPGGIGKTVAAISVGHAQFAAFGGDVQFLDLGQLSEAHIVQGALASMLGLPVRSDDPIPSLLTYLKERRMLLIFDSCEHLVDPLAALAERIFHEAPQVSILATSRETLQIEGEYVYRLPALACPSEDEQQSAEQVLSFPAARLFVERVIANGHPFELTDRNAPVVAQICRKLDGIPLAIELVAAGVRTHGLCQTAALLDDELPLLWRGRRTAHPRHQTLTAALNWSYDLLSETEQAMLRCISIFRGPFTLEAACEVGTDVSLDYSQVVHLIGQLIAKSLISAEISEGATLYRLLDTTRTYARGKLVDKGEADNIVARFGQHYLPSLGNTSAGSG